MNMKTFKNVIIWTVILAIVAIIAIFGFRHYNTYLKEDTTENESVSSSTNVEELSEDTSAGIDTSLKDGGLTLESMEYEYNSFIGKMGIYTQVWYSDTDYFIEVYNTNKEAIVQYQDDANTSIVFTNKDVSVQFGYDETNGNYVLASGNMDVINQLGLAISAVKQDIGTFQALDLSDNYEETTYAFAVDLNGFEEIYEFYNLIDNDTSNMLVGAYKEQFEYMGFMNTEEDSEMSLRFIIVCNETSGLIEGGIEYYAGDQIKGLGTDPEVFIYEVFNEYYLIPDWSLTNDWYSTDFSTLTSSEETVEQCQNMLTNLISDIKEIMDNYFNENYTLDSDVEIENGEVVDNTEDLDNTDNSGDYQGETNSSDLD